MSKSEMSKTQREAFLKFVEGKDLSDPKVIAKTTFFAAHMLKITESQLRKAFLNTTKEQKPNE